MHIDITEEKTFAYKRNLGGSFVPVSASVSVSGGCSPHLFGVLFCFVFIFFLIFKFLASFTPVNVDPCFFHL